MIEREKEPSSGTYPVVVTELPNQIVFRSSLNHVTHFTFVSKNNVSRHSIQHVRNEAFWIVLISQIFGRSDEGLSLKWPALHFCEPALALISCFCCDLAIKMAKMLCSGFLMVFITRKVFRQISLEIHQFSFSYNDCFKKGFLFLFKGSYIRRWAPWRWIFSVVFVAQQKNGQKNRGSFSRGLVCHM